MNPKDHIDIQERWLSGESVAEFAFLHNSVVEITLADGKKKEGWIVAATILNGQTTYIVESCDGSGDHELPADSIRKLSPEEPIQLPEPMSGLAPGHGSS